MSKDLIELLQSLDEARSARLRFADTLVSYSNESCSDCGGGAGRVRYTPGSCQPDPQTEEVCPTCEGSGRREGYTDSHLRW